MVTIPRRGQCISFVGGDGSPPPREIKGAMALLLKVVLLHGTQAIFSVTSHLGR